MQRFWLVLLTLLFSFSGQASTGENSSFTGQWMWQDPSGSAQQLDLHFSSQRISQAESESFKISYSLTYPMKAISAYLSPRLKHAVQRIHEHSEIPVDQLMRELKHRDYGSGPESHMLWAAYDQYRFDAFRHLNVLPCLHPLDVSIPCVRPNYSQLFYQHRQHISPLVQHFSAAGDLNQAVANLHSWLTTIPNKNESIYSFSPPLDVLRVNQADSDEKALLLAVVLSYLAPDSPLYMVYPENSVGSVSPAWLAIDANSGIEGPTIMIDQHPHTILSGPPQLIKEMLLADVKMISDSLY